MFQSLNPGCELKFAWIPEDPELTQFSKIFSHIQVFQNNIMRFLQSEASELMSDFWLCSNGELKESEDEPTGVQLSVSGSLTSFLSASVRSFDESNL